MRFAVVDDRAVVLEEAGAIDIATVSDGRFGPDAESVLRDWAGFTAWAGGGLAGAPRVPLSPTARFGPPGGRPPQAFGIGANYADHAAEAGMAPPDRPMVFSKFPSSIVGADHPVAISGDTVDWEVELVVVIGAECHDVPAERAWERVAGLTVGQDISDRTLQFADATTPQFNLGKSRPGFGPVGPWLVTPDELADPDDLAIGCAVNGKVVQKARTGSLIHPVPALIAYLSSVLTLLPGDLILTGTPAGVGLGRVPPVYLAPGDTIVSSIEGIGELRTEIVAAP